MPSKYEENGWRMENKGEIEWEDTYIYKNWYFNVDKVENMPVEHCMITLLTATVATVQYHTITNSKSKKFSSFFVWCNVKICIWYGNSRGNAQNKYRYTENSSLYHNQFDSRCSISLSLFPSYSFNLLLLLFFCLLSDTYFFQAFFRFCCSLPNIWHSAYITCTTFPFVRTCERHRKNAYNLPKRAAILCVHHGINPNNSNQFFRRGTQFIC